MGTWIRFCSDPCPELCSEFRGKQFPRKRQVCFPYALDFPFVFPLNEFKTLDDLRTDCGSHKISCRRACLIGCPKIIHTSPELTGSAPRSALRAEPAEDEFAFAKNPLTEGARSRPGHVVPLHVLYIAAAVADEVVMLRAFRIEARGAALDGHFTHQTRLDQVPQIVISRGP